MKSWKELEEDSKRHAEQSKPEFIAIIEILKNNDNGALSVTQIHELIEKIYHREVTRRQIYYYIELMEKNKILEEEYSNNKEKLYSLINIEEKVKKPISYTQLALLGFSIALAVIYQNRVSDGFLIGIVIVIVLTHVQYYFFKRKER